MLFFFIDFPWQLVWRMAAAEYGRRRRALHLGNKEKGKGGAKIWAVGPKGNRSGNLCYRFGDQKFNQSSKKLKRQVRKSVGVTLFVCFFVFPNFPEI